ncbi:MAG: glycosyltransferase family 4 protein [Candidatus Bathyarchaeota archaeon]|nr:glycosyltransferase family 4 protein [Candidatus Bathyarchaeota archaeon]
MRIALVTPYFPPEVGGIETYTYELARRLSRTNAVYVFTCGRGATETYDGLRVFRLRAIDMQNLPLSLKVPYPIPPSLMSKLVKFDLDIIHAHGHAFATTLQAALAARLARKPFVITVHDIGTAYLDYMVMRGSRLILDSTIVRYVFRRADMVISQNEATYTYASKLRPRRIVTIPQAVDLARFEPREEGEAVAFIAARLVPQKGGETFVRAVPKVVKAIGEVKFMVIGDGMQKSRLENLAGELGVADRIEFVGRIPHEKVPECLGEARIVVFPSEIPTGLALLEAAAVRRAIITTRNVWAVDSLGDTPFYISARDPEGTANAIIRLLSNDEERSKIARLVYEKVADGSSWDSVASRHKEIYRQLINEK